jgi:hypothetical protein
MTYNSNLIVTLIATLLLAITGLCIADEYKPDPNYIPTCRLSRFFAKIKSGQPVVLWASVDRLQKDTVGRL